MKRKDQRILAVFSDVDFSPQLIAILQKLCDRGAEVCVVLIGNEGLQIAKEIQVLVRDSKFVIQRGKFGSLFNLLVVVVEIIRFRPKTLFASGQFATIIGMFSAKLLNVPNRVFIRHHSSFHHKYKMKFGLLVDHTSNRLATKIIAVSALVKNIMIQDEFVKKDKVAVIYNGVDLRNFKSKPLVSKLASRCTIAKAPLFHIGVISRLTEWKGVQYTAKAFVKLQNEFPNARLHIVGAFADSYSDVKNILSAVASDKYTMEKSNFDIPLFLHGLGAFVHVPVGIDDEAFGIVYIEALASGIPCIFTKSGVLHELKGLDSYAHIVAYRNSEDIYLNLKNVIQGVRATKNQVPKSWLNQFSLDEMAQSYADLLLREGR
jgi:glycosyltransferase involved in cell wall biosynthesis